MLRRNCEYDKPMEALFFTSCGTGLVEGNASDARPLDSCVETKFTDRLAHEPEHPQMTVMSCELLDPE